VTTSEAITEGIRVEVTARHAPEHAEPSRWFFLYTIRVSNEGQETVQLLSRHWVIRDATGKIEEVQGENPTSTLRAARFRHRSVPWRAATNS